MRRFTFIVAIFIVFSGIFGVVSSASADALGDIRIFNVDALYDAVGAQSVSATNRAMGQNAYFYVDDRYWTSLSEYQRSQFEVALTQLRNEFDSIIYPRTTTFWGDEPKPGVDHDPLMTVLIENMSTGSGGYFKTINEYPVSIAPTSNAREMVYINAASVLSGAAKDYLAHEFQHLISFNQKELLLGVSDDIWLNEARSEYNITNVGYDDIFSGSSLERRVAAFLRNPSDSLVEWPNVPTDYSITSMFTHYIADRFNPVILADTIHSREAGVVALNSALINHGVTEDFSGVFTYWMVASYINNPTAGDQYQYARPGLQAIHVSPQSRIFLNNTSSITVAVKEWQPVWLEFNLASDIMAPTVTIQITGQSGFWSGALIGNYSDGHHRVVVLDGIAKASISTSDNNSRLVSMVLAYTQGAIMPVDDRTVSSLTSTVNVALGDVPIPTPDSTPAPASSSLRDGDLIRRAGQEEIYVIWGPYRRYLTSSTLALYGFQDRPVTPVTDDVFFSYQSSNYIRAIDQERVYAIWPDGTKHWLNITPTQWDASGRDWGAIFIVNDSEVNSYVTGSDITQ